jgi:hypothetical protein
MHYYFFTDKHIFDVFKTHNNYKRQAGRVFTISYGVIDTNWSATSSYIRDINFNQIKDYPQSNNFKDPLLREQIFKISNIIISGLLA